MNEVSTKLTKINFKWLIEHCTDKTNWKRSWTLFDYDNLQINMKINEINIVNNELVLLIVGKNDYWSNIKVYIPLDEQHFNEDIFTKKIYNALYKKIKEYEYTKIKETSIYKQANFKDEKAYDDFEKKLNDYLDKKSVLDEEIRTVFIDSKMGDFEGNKYRDEIINAHWEKMCTSHYAMLALQFNKQKDYQKLMNLSIVNEEKLQERFKEIEYDLQEEVDNLIEG